MQEVYDVAGGVDPRAGLALGGGIGCAGDACGILTGGAVAIGLLVGDHVADLERAKALSRELALSYYRDFVKEFGHADCLSLTDIDMSTEEGRQLYKTSGCKDNRCTKYLAYAVRRLMPIRDEVKAATAG